MTKKTHSKAKALEQNLNNNQDLKNNDDLALDKSSDQDLDKELPKEINGPKGLEPTRYGDWESKGRCHDF